ncbi:MAG: hypothetical protein PHI03_01020 [Bacteroidales bacterium]|jgi:pyruvate/2-oxoglutarate dehydrogenase complex dihydrolipoamide dehydrogenase (E3) component|nr:hypothetical protein [Bacteroidales bacterium]MDD4671491.1 hypothetical protein [Bacteroidales bacterium]MDY0348515.1 hypothetical protein [Tenuifilaceae bacterium]
MQKDSFHISKMVKFDVFIIADVANKCAEGGFKTAIIVNRNYGGTCGLQGCIPKKYYPYYSSLINLMNNAGIKPMAIRFFLPLRRRTKTHR